MQDSLHHRIQVVDSSHCGSKTSEEPCFGEPQLGPAPVTSDQMCYKQRDQHSRGSHRSDLVVQSIDCSRDRGEEPLLGGGGAYYTKPLLPLMPCLTNNTANALEGLTVEIWLYRALTVAVTGVRTPALGEGRA